MVGLAGIGTGIGGFMSGFNQSQQTAMQLAAMRDQLQQQRKQQQARALITQVLGAAPAAGFSGGINGAPGLPAGGMPGGGAPQAPPPMPGQPSMPAPAPQPAPQQQAPQQPSPYYPALSQPAAAPIMQERVPAPGQQLATPDEGAEIIPGSAVTPPGGQTPPPTSIGPAGAPPSAPGDAGGGAAPQGGAGGQQTAPQPPAPPQAVVAGSNEGDLIVSDPKTGQAFNFSKMLHPESFQDIVQRIKKARPNADDETVEMAAEKLYTLANQGDKIQQVGALATLKYLGLNANIVSRENIAAANILGRANTNAATNQTRVQTTGMTQSGANQRNANTVTGADQRSEAAIVARAANIKIIQDRMDARFNQSLQTRQLSMQQRQQATMVNNSYKNIMTQLSAIRAQTQLGQQGALSTEQKATLKSQSEVLQDQAVKLYAQLKGMGLAVDTPATLLGNEATIRPAQ